jgi:hypothetical protein
VHDIWFISSSPLEKIPSVIITMLRARLLETMPVKALQTLLSSQICSFKYL